MKEGLPDRYQQFWVPPASSQDQAAATSTYYAELYAKACLKPRPPLRLLR